MSYFEFPHTRTYDSDLGWLIKHVGSYDEVIQTLNNWIAENQPELDDFEALYNIVAYIPDGWDDIIFNTTGYDITIADTDFGHLTLNFNTYTEV